MFNKITDKIKELLLFKNDDSHEFKPILSEIQDAPINPIGHTIFWLIISFIIIAFSWMYFGRVDVVVSARGIIIPDGEEKIIQSLDKGVVKNIFVKEGDYVEKDKILAIITPAEHEPALELNNLKEEEKMHKEQLSALLAKYSFVNDRLKRLASVQDIIPQATYDEVKQESIILSHDIARVRIALKEITNKKEQLEKQKQIIKAPLDGYVNKLFIHTIGGVVTPAQELMSVVPKSAKFKIKAKVLNQDIGFIKEGMEALVKVDTFNFQKYGILDGNVELISPNSIEDEHLGTVYEVYIKPVNTKLMVEGKEEEIKFGMTTTNEIKINKRRIIEFFIYPLIKYLDESIKVR